jgi:hypothetical protein
LGRERLDDLEARAGPKKWSQDELRALQIYYKEKIKAIERGEDPRSHTSEDLWAVNNS